MKTTRSLAIGALISFVLFLGILLSWYGAAWAWNEELTPLFAALFFLAASGGLLLARARLHGKERR